MKSITKEGENLEAQIAKLQNTYNSVYANYESGMRNQTLTENNRISLETKLGGMQQEMQNFQNTKMVAFQDKQMKSTEIMLNKIEKYAEEYSKANGISLLLIKGAGSTIAYADGAFDVTVGFVEYMNAKEKELNGGK